MIKVHLHVHKIVNTEIPPGLHFAYGSKREIRIGIKCNEYLG